MARPYIAGDNRKTERVYLTLTPEEYSDLRAYAQHLNRSMTDCIRQYCFSLLTDAKRARLFRDDDDVPF